MSDRFLTLAGPGQAQLRVRGSTFLAEARPAADEDEARALLAEHARTHFAAAHHCSAWSLRDGTRRANDAGEPSGSAGAPILAAIDAAGLTDCVVVVTRYFGGTKLGVGGLGRAYGAAAAQALVSAHRRAGILVARLRVRYPYRHTSAVMRVLEQYRAYEVEHGFAAGGVDGELRFSVPLAFEAEARAALIEATAGAVEPILESERIVYEPSPH